MIKIEILKTSGCAKCNRTVEELEAILNEEQQKYSEVTFETIDISEHPDIAIKYRLLTTPAVAINGKLEFRGALGADRIRDKIEALL